MGTTEKEMNILELDQDEKTGLVYIKDSKKIFTGVGKTYYENDKIAYEENYLNGKLNGNSKFYYENGNLKADLFYKNDMLDGTVIEYLEDGKKTSVSNYKNGKLEGEKLSYYKNGSLYIEANYSNDELDGDLDYIAPCELLTTNTLTSARAMSVLTHLIKIKLHSKSYVKISGAVFYIFINIVIVLK